MGNLEYSSEVSLTLIKTQRQNKHSTTVELLKNKSTQKNMTVSTPDVTGIT